MPFFLVKFVAVLPDPRVAWFLLVPTGSTCLQQAKRRERRAEPSNPRAARSLRFYRFARTVDGYHPSRSSTFVGISPSCPVQNILLGALGSLFCVVWRRILIANNTPLHFTVHHSSPRELNSALYFHIIQPDLKKFLNETTNLCSWFIHH